MSRDGIITFIYGMKYKETKLLIIPSRVLSNERKVFVLPLVVLRKLVIVTFSIKKKCF